MKIVFLLFAFIFVFASEKSDLYNAYKNQDYQTACYLGAKIYLQNRQDTDLLTIFADSCLKVDNINRMAFPAMLLVRDKEARENAIYFLTILYQKKLLYSALADGLDISKYNLPATDYILSKIFVKYAKKDYKKSGDVYLFDDDKDKNKRYELQLIKESGIVKMMLKSFINNTLYKTRIYW